eukprot:TRINITY_DN2438_c1_g1_i1.p1 TRINITY_DN2438_c1_g1~~TRINITY_DN2438_c1_g1_i1.p1  ORF type:complete len:522 (+),score=154.02 TRINITY_DN2438_c1_g1_i1:16-1581(+)
MHSSSINIREIVRNSIDGGTSSSSPLRYGMIDNSSSSGGGSSGPLPENSSSLLKPGPMNDAKTVPILPSSGKGKRKRNTHEDPMSHRIIEKRRRDRMNNCLADLSRLIPSSYSKKERGRIEKTEIIEMAIRHLKNLQAHCTCGIFDSAEMDHSETSSTAYIEDNSLDSRLSYFKLGYDECTTEVINFLVESEAFYVGDSLCVRLTRHLGRSFNVKYKGGGGGGSGNLGKRHAPSSTSFVHGTSSSSSDTGSYGRGTKHGELGSEHHHFSNGMEGDKYLYKGGANLLSDVSRNPWTQHFKSSQYKFKSNMHERFSHQKPYDLSKSALAKAYRKSEQITPLDYSSPSFSWATSLHNHPLHPPPPPHLPQSHHKSTEESLFKPYSHIETPEPTSKMDAFPPSSSPRSNVPIFALHPKEGYYMALSVDSSLIDPYLVLFTQIDKVSLHPITISVNFCGPMALAFGSYNSANNNGTQNSSSNFINSSYHPPEAPSGQKNDNESSNKKSNSSSNNSSYNGGNSSDNV